MVRTDEPGSPRHLSRLELVRFLRDCGGWDKLTVGYITRTAGLPQGRLRELIRGRGHARVGEALRLAEAIRGDYLKTAVALDHRRGIVENRERAKRDAEEAIRDAWAE